MKVFLSGWNRSEVLRGPGACANVSLPKGSDPSRTPRMFRFISHFRPSEFCTAEGPDAHRAMRADTPGGHRDPRVIPDTARVPLEIFVSSLCKMSISSVN